MTDTTTETAATLAAEVISRITDHLGQPRISGTPDGARTRGEYGAYTRYYAAWFPNNVNHGIAVDDYRDHIRVLAYNHRGVNIKLTYRGRLPELANLVHAARAAGLLPGVTAMQDLPELTDADEVNAEFNSMRVRTSSEEA